MNRGGKKDDIPVCTGLRSVHMELRWWGIRIGYQDVCDLGEGGGTNWIFAPFVGCNPDIIRQCS